MIRRRCCPYGVTVRTKKLLSLAFTGNYNFTNGNINNVGGNGNWWSSTANSNNNARNLNFNSGNFNPQNNNNKGNGFSVRCVAQ